MSRWEPDARGRLERAALELFTEQGFAETTVPQITARAGLTTRTFFRYFADKREVLFAGEDEMRDLFADLIRAAPPELSAMGAIEHALSVAAETEFEPRRTSLRQWRDVVAGEDALRERGLRKQQSIIEAAARALAERGVDAATAELTAGIAFVVFQAAVAEWTAEQATARPLTAYIRASFARMQKAVAEG